jgi:predicted MFS family arabinose efflux permease
VRVRGPDGTTSGSYRWYAFALLLLVYVSHVVARLSISVIIEPVKSEFHVGDGAMGFVGGMAACLAVVVAAMPIGWLADRVNRRKLLAICLTLWSGLTLLGGLASNFAMLVATRLGIGAAESGSVPICLSLIADLFPPKQRATAVSIFYMGASVGTALVFFGGGAIASAFGWRAALAYAGIPGVILAAVTFSTLRDTRRGQAEDGVGATTTVVRAPSVATTVKYVFQSPVMRNATIALTVASVASGSVVVWLGSFLIRTHGLSISKAGLVIGIGLGIAQAAGAAIGGPVSDCLSVDRPNRVGIVPAVSLALSVPIGIAMVLAPTAPVAVGLAILLGFASGGWVGPGYSLALNAAPTEMRGGAMAFVYLCFQVGVGFGPVLTGAVSDLVGGAGSLRPALICALLFYLWASAHFALASRPATLHRTIGKAAMTSN